MNDPLVIGYGFTDTDTHPVPIFSNEGYKGKVYKTLDEAIKAFRRKAKCLERTK